MGITIPQIPSFVGLRTVRQILAPLHSAANQCKQKHQQSLAIYQVLSNMFINLLLTELIDLNCDLRKELASLS